MLTKGRKPAENPAAGSKAGFAALKNHRFRLLFISNGAFFFAMNGQMVVRSVLAFDITGSEAALGFVNLAVAIPMLLISPFGGVVADRFDRTRTVMAGQLIIMLNELMILLLLATGHLHFWHLLAAVAVQGCIFPFMMPARQSITADIVGRGLLANAMALNMSAMNGARVIAPALAGLVIWAVGVRWMYLIAVIMYTTAFLSMSRVHAPRLTERVKKSVIRDMAEGMQYVRRDPTVRALLLFSVVPMLLGMPFQALLVVFSDEVWHTGDLGLGILNAAAGAGGIMGSFLVAFMGDRRRPMRIMLAGVLGFSGSLFLFAISPWFLLALPLVLVADACVNVAQTMNSTTTNMIIPDHVRGRVMSLMMMSFGLTPLGTLPVALAADRWGAPTAVAGAAIVTAAISVVYVLLSRSLRHLDVEEARERAEREYAPGIEPATGIPAAAPSASAAR